MTPTRYTALRWGALLGGALGVFETLLYLLTLRNGTMEDYLMLGVFMIVLEWVVPLAAGLLAARETGEAPMGLLAGVVSGVIVAIISLIYSVLAPTPTVYGGSTSVAEQILSLFLSTVMTIAVGAVAGWLGGQAWLRRTKRQ